MFLARMNWWTRILLSLVIGLALALVISEGTYRLLSGGGDREPRQVELVIPAGTAQQVEAGLPAPEIPESMEFVQGDTLVVVNQDSASHQLGPVWVPPQSTGSLTLDTADQFSLTCSFTPEKFMGLYVSTRATWNTRIQAMFILGLPMGGLLAVYSFLLAPKRPEPAAQA